MMENCKSPTEALLDPTPVCEAAACPTTMKPESLVLLHLAASVTKVLGDSDCFQALSLDVGNVTLSNGQTAKGVVMEVGTPPQSLAFLPLMPLNNSFVYGTSGYCNSVTSGWSVDGCTTFRGGAYDPTNSSTMQSDGAASLFASDATGTYPDLEKLSDTVVLGSNFTLENFPVGIAQGDWGGQGYYPQAGLGLGPKSTLLSTLVDSGTISSRTWSWFWGLDGPNVSEQLDGSLVLGGYDKAKVSGTGYTSPITTGSDRCATGLFVTLSDVLVHMVDGTSVSIFTDDNQALLAACIDPSYPSLTTIPYSPYWYNFQTITNASISGRSQGLQWYNMRYDDGQTPFTGDISMEFASGLIVRVPNSEYVRPDVTINKNTGVLEVNSTEPDVVAMISLQGSNSNDVIKIGRNFFSAAYLMVNYDSSEFTIWPANRTASQDLVAVDSRGAELDSLCSSNKNATVTAGGAKPSDRGTDTAKSFDSSGNSSTPVGPIVGGVVGGVVGIATISLAACLLMRRLKAKKEPQVAEFDHDGVANGLAPSTYRRSTKYEAAPLSPEYPDPLPELAPESLIELPSMEHGERHDIWRSGAETPRYELPGAPAVYEM
ncbi:hypothetical protein J7T55_003212 [Diaporthe amygdali]|uniref:uncharacterized protein n=1 Tax=Phomopsis amygdali TaxID=1214568 RepID=UPI0022FEC871|nr:uncharacterized protein J7T55_003212 [Diaporthe amygdali]KAJ0122696.1 hypothetical protein J7T55_003212 [Diaporthe amygdali]